MGTNKQIPILFFLLLLVMVSCVVVHVDDFSESSQDSYQIFDNLPLIKNESQINKEKENIESKPLLPNEEKVTTNIEETNKEPSNIITEENKEIAPVIEETPLKIDTSNEEIIPKEEVVEAVKDEKSLQEQIDEIEASQKIIFKRLSTDITEESSVTVEKIAELLKANPKVRIEIGGHTDAKGKDDVNLWVSQQRALSVKNELVKLGIEKTRIKAKGYGETMPKVPNDKNGYSIENRRVEFKIIEE